MPRHAAHKKQQGDRVYVQRSPLAEQAYRAGIVTGTLDLTRPAALTVRERAMKTAARNGAALGMIAAMIWVYDVASVIRG